MKNVFRALLAVFLFLLSNVPVPGAEELYIITTRDGSSIVARDYRFTDEYVEYTTDNGLPGYISRDQFVSIANMVGTPPGEAALLREQVSREERNKRLLLLAVAVTAVVFFVLLVYLSGRRKKDGGEEDDIYYKRREMEPATQGHLSFDYKGSLNRIARWTIEVRSAYEEEGILYVEGICTTTDRRKTFRADRVVGPVTDMSSDHHAPMDHFFTPARAGDEEKK